MSNRNKVNIGNLFKIAKNTTCFVSTKSGKYPRATKSLIPFILNEQEKIVNKVETLLAKVATLENQIQDRKSLSDKLIFGIIKENLENKKC